MKISGMMVVAAGGLLYKELRKVSSFQNNFK